MSLHDAYARATPFEVAFPDPDGLSALAVAVAEETAARGVDPAGLGAFVTLGAVGAFVNEIRAHDDDPTAVHRYAALVYHALHFQREACPVYVLDAALARYLVESEPAGEPRTPTRSGYLQLPQHMFWVGASVEGGSPESLDGFFWTVAADALHTLAVVGLRPGRPGFSVLPLPEAPLGDAEEWVSARGRTEGEDFRSDLPGRDLDGLYGVETAGEVLKLLARFFAYVDAVPEATLDHGAADGEAGGPAPSGLPYSRVALVA